MTKDDVAGVRTQRDEVARVQFKLGLLVIRDDVMNFHVLVTAARRAKRLAFKMLPANPRPSACPLVVIKLPPQPRKPS
jgi:hypothetical protein